MTGILHASLVHSSQGAKETARRARVTRRAERLNLQQKSIAVAVNPYCSQTLKITGHRSLVPKLLPASTPEMCLTGFNGYAKRFFVCPGNHQHLPGADILDNDGQ
jgi:hypothetical protein